MSDRLSDAVRRAARAFEHQRRPAIEDILIAVRWMLRDDGISEQDVARELAALREESSAAHGDPSADEPPSIGSMQSRDKGLAGAARED